MTNLSPNNSLYSLIPLQSSIILCIATSRSTVVALSASDLVASGQSCYSWFSCKHLNCRQWVGFVLCSLNFCSPSLFSASPDYLEPYSYDLFLTALINDVCRFKIINLSLIVIVIILLCIGTYDKEKNHWVVVFRFQTLEKWFSV